MNQTAHPSSFRFHPLFSVFSVRLWLKPLGAPLLLHDTHLPELLVPLLPKPRRLEFLQLLQRLLQARRNQCRRLAAPPPPAPPPLPNHLLHARPPPPLPHPPP